MLERLMRKAADITLDIDPGDILLGGKFKNSPITVKEFGTDENGQPTVNDKKLLAMRIKKEMPGQDTAEEPVKTMFGKKSSAFATDDKLAEEYEKWVYSSPVIQKIDELRYAVRRKDISPEKRRMIAGMLVRAQEQAQEEETRLFGDRITKKGERDFNKGEGISIALAGGLARNLGVVPVLAAVYGAPENVPAFNRVMDMAEREGVRVVRPKVQPLGPEYFPDFYGRPPEVSPNTIAYGRNVRQNPYMLGHELGHARNYSGRKMLGTAAIGSSAVQRLLLPAMMAALAVNYNNDENKEKILKGTAIAAPLLRVPRIVDEIIASARALKIGRQAGAAGKGRWALGAGLSTYLLEALGSAAVPYALHRSGVLYSDKHKEGE